MLLEFTKETAIQLLRMQETIDFPVDFDEAYQWLGYTRKDNAKDTFLELGFLEGVDFSSFSRKSSGGRPAESFKLTVDCFKKWGMRAGTEKGDQIRLYFLECERIAHAPKTAVLAARYPDEAVKSVADAIDFVRQKIAPYDPRQAQILIDHAMRGLDDYAVLPAAKPKLSGCVEIAQKLGYKVSKDDSALGRHVAKNWRAAYNTEPQKVERECGGGFRNLKLYPIDDPVVIAAIKEFYNKEQQ